MASFKIETGIIKITNEGTVTLIKTKNYEVGTYRTPLIHIRPYSVNSN